ncbi:response regulator [Nocardioides cavernaquae]|uniref:Transcriptional regulatory protein n=1 Tax=Nocardioides cavernaquae TaxID=2321396 RepID=A0A3A5HAE9_9ACTN|nr:response regulator [Nocardioides cavernaquae]RJS44997.1 response regulator [Nocardioides cavernaquae]
MTSPEQSGQPDEIAVLVVDDDFMVASIHTRFVDRTAGFRVVGNAATGTAALAEVARLRPDLVLLDVHLPDLSGLDVLRRLRAGGDDVGVIMVTAAREADTVRSAAANGAAHYLVKPFEYDDLRVRLEAFRSAYLALGDSGFAEQGAIDALFVPAGLARRADPPKGLSEPTAALVLAALTEAGELSAAECAAGLGLSRVTARRYLEHFVTTDQAGVRLRYGGGRPERIYLAR